MHHGAIVDLPPESCHRNARRQPAASKPETAPLVREAELGSQNSKGSDERTNSLIMVDAWTWNWEISIPSQPQAGTDLLEELIQQLENRNWLAHDVFGIRLAAEEALVNAIRHGNQSDEAKRVHVSLKMTETRIRLEIRDEGPGFNPTDVPDPTEDDNLEIPSGRGIMLMRNFMSFVEYNETGNCVIMEKERGHDNGEAQDGAGDEPDRLV